MSEMSCFIIVQTDTMTPEQFKAIWESVENEFVCPFSINELSGIGLKETTVHFLLSAGLPVDAAPFLDFAKSGGSQYNRIEKLTDHYNHLNSDFGHYVYIGSDGGSNPIVINTDDGDRIELLDHEDDFSSLYINSSLDTFMQCLVAQRDFIKTIQTENGEDAAMDSNFTDDQLDVFKNALLSADAHSLMDDCFWKEQVEMELANREYYRENPDS